MLLTTGSLVVQLRRDRQRHQPAEMHSPGDQSVHMIEMRAACVAQLTDDRARHRAARVLVVNLMTVRRCGQLRYRERAQKSPTLASGTSPGKHSGIHLRGLHHAVHTAAKKFSDAISSTELLLPRRIHGQKLDKHGRGHQHLRVQPSESSMSVLLRRQRYYTAVTLTHLCMHPSLPYSLHCSPHRCLATSQLGN
jgi:hypothetical protein